MKEQPECYGKMFPDVSCLEKNKEHKGKAFSILIKSLGIGSQSKDVNVNEAEWQKCQECPNYRSCYDLCMAKSVCKFL